MKKRSPFLLSLALAPLVAAGCGGSGGGGGTTVFFESEPNGDPDFAPFISYVHDNSHFRVKGSVDNGGPDLYDGLVFETLEPLTIEFVLRGHNPFADVDLALYDPDFDETIGQWNSFGDESGGFTILDGDKEFHLVVETFNADTAYTLEVWGYPAFLAESGGPGTAAASASIVVTEPSADAVERSADRPRYGRSSERAEPPVTVEWIAEDERFGIVRRETLPLPAAEGGADPSARSQ